MGRRKTRAKPPPKPKKVGLETVFDCPFCNNAKSVECQIDRIFWIAAAICGACKERYTTTATPLTEPIDIYSEWIDECERVNQRD